MFVGVIIYFMRHHFSKHNPKFLPLIVIIGVIVITFVIWKYQEASKNIDTQVVGVQNVSNQKSVPVTTQVVPVTVHFSSSNEWLVELREGTTVLGKNFLDIRPGDGEIILGRIYTSSGDVGDSCTDTVNAQIEIANIKDEGKKTWQDKPAASVDVISVISHEKYQRTCAY